MLRVLRCLIYKVQAFVRLAYSAELYYSTPSFACQAPFFSFRIFSCSAARTLIQAPLPRTPLFYHAHLALSRPFFDSLESFLTVPALAGPACLALDYISKSLLQCQPPFSTFFVFFRRPSFLLRPHICLAKAPPL